MLGKVRTQRGPWEYYLAKCWKEESGPIPPDETMAEDDLEPLEAQCQEWLAANPTGLCVIYWMQTGRRETSLAGPKRKEAGFE